ncbi:membrane protein insertase YidC, partial [Xanthomonas citri pv. citri]
SGFIGANGIDNSNGRATFTAPSKLFVMQPNQAELVVPLTYQKDGVTIIKSYKFTKGQYPINVSYNITNNGTQPWQGQMYAQLKRDNSEDPGKGDKGAISLSTYLGGAWGTPDQPYNKLKFGNFNEGLKASSDKGWIGMVQHYFVTA